MCLFLSIVHEKSPDSQADVHVQIWRKASPYSPLFAVAGGAERLNLATSGSFNFSAEHVDWFYDSGGQQIGSRNSMKGMNSVRSGRYQQAVIVSDQKLQR